MEGRRLRSSPALGLAVALAVLLGGYGYVYSLPMPPIVLMPAGTVVAFTGWGLGTIRAWNVTGIGAHLSGAWTTTNGTQFWFGPQGPPTPILIPVRILCHGRFDLDLPQGGYFISFSGAAGTTLTVTDALVVVHSDHVVREMGSGPANELAACGHP